MNIIKNKNVLSLNKITKNSILLNIISKKQITFNYNNNSYFILSKNKEFSLINSSKYNKNSYKCFSSLLKNKKFTNNKNTFYYSLNRNYHKDIDYNKDYYSILEVDKSATEKDIKLAYHKMAKKYHPDLNKSSNSAEKFKQINEAYEVLGDKDKKSSYDSFKSGGGNPFSNFGFNSSSKPKYTYNNNQSKYSNFGGSSFSSKDFENFYSNFTNSFNDKGKDTKFTSGSYTFTFRDPKTGKYKTYTYNSNSNDQKQGNPFYTDYNEILKQRRKERQEREKNNGQDGYYYDPNSNFKNNSQYNNNFNNDFNNFNYNETYKRNEIWKVIRWTAILTIFVYFYSITLNKKRDYYNKQINGGERTYYTMSNDDKYLYGGMGGANSYGNNYQERPKRPYYDEKYRTHLNNDEVPPYK